MVSKVEVCHSAYLHFYPFRLIFETHLSALRFPSSRKDFRGIVPIRSETLLGKSKVAKGDMSEPLSHGNGISS